MALVVLTLLDTDKGIKIDGTVHPPTDQKSGVLGEPPTPETMAQAVGKMMFEVAVLASQDQNAFAALRFVHECLSNHRQQLILEARAKAAQAAKAQKKDAMKEPAKKPEIKAVPEEQPAAE